MTTRLRQTITPVSASQPANDASASPWLSPRLSVRRAYLCDLRETQPAYARQLVQSTWATDDARTRCAYLNAIYVGLSMDDEPFLESALDDRSKRVRSAAAYLLSGLSQSRLVQRTIAQVAPLIFYHQGAQGEHAYISVTLPDNYTPDMKRDCIFPKSTDPAVSSQASWLGQMLTRIHPGFWAQQFGASAPRIIDAAFHTANWDSLLLRSWISATVRYEDPDWAEALLAYDLTPLTPFTSHYILSLVPAGRREGVLQRALTQRPNVLHAPGFPIYMLYVLEQPWSLDFSRFVLNRLAYYANPSTPEDQEVLKPFHILETTLNPAIYPEAQARLGPPTQINPYLADPITHLLQTLQSRQEPTNDEQQTQ